MKYLKLTLCYLIQILTFLAFQSCDKVEDDIQMGNWVRTTPFKGPRRSSAIEFTIGDKAYVGLGYNGSDYLKDFYEFDPNLGFWQTKSPFPGEGRERAIAFSIGNKGYIGLGYNRDLLSDILRDVWEYNPATDTWTQLDDFGGTARYNAVSFAIAGRAYVGTGNDGSNNYGDFWEYNPGTDSWQEIASYPGQKREEALAFVLEDKAYVCTGRNNGLHDTDFWEFDPEGRSWTRRTPGNSEDNFNDFTSAVGRHNAVAFTMNGKAYITTGINSSGSLDNSVWEFDPLTQLWDRKTAFEGASRSLAVAFTVAGRTFVGTGQNSSSRFDDMWEFRPDEAYDETD